MMAISEMALGVVDTHGSTCVDDIGKLDIKYKRREEKHS